MDFLFLLSCSSLLKQSPKMAPCDCLGSAAGLWSGPAARGGAPTPSQQRPLPVSPPSLLFFMSSELLALTQPLTQAQRTPQKQTVDTDFIFHPSR